MKKVGVLNEWRERLDEISLPDCRIQDDFMLVKDYNISPQYFDPFTLDVTTAVFCLEGTVVFDINMTRYKIEAPFMLVMLADEILQCVEASDNVTMKALVMSRRFSEGLFNSNSHVQRLFRSLHQQPVMKLDNTDVEVLEQYFMLVKNLLGYVDNPYRIEAVQHLTLTLFYGYFFKKHQQEDSELKSRSGEVVQQFMELLRRNYRKEHLVGFYAEQLFLTPKYLSKMVKQTSGKSVTEWIEEYIIIESKALLRSTDMTIQQISWSLNFPSQSIFGKFFKRLTGLSPREYRNQSLH